METNTELPSLNTEELFGRAYKSVRDLPKFLTDGERAVLGAKKFKRMTLGLCGTSTVKSIDEMAKIMWELKMVDTLDEGRELVPTLYGRKIEYSSFSSRGLEFVKVKDPRGNEACRISVHYYA